MKILVLGSGGVGGCIGAYLSKAGKDVTLIARGQHLEKMQEQGLVIESSQGQEIIPVHAMELKDYKEIADVIFVCFKGYSLMNMVDEIKRVSDAHTIIIPILNVYGTGARLQKLVDAKVCDGCIYIASEIKEPGVIWKKGEIFKLVYGRRDHVVDESLVKIQKDLMDSGIEAIVSRNIQAEAFEKYSYISAAATCGLYYHATAEAMQKPGKERELFAQLVHEIETLARAMDIPFQKNMVEYNLSILDSLDSQASTSMQRDIMQGKPSEIDGLIYEVGRLAKKYGVKLPCYQKIIAQFQQFC